MPVFAGITILGVNYEGEDRHSPSGCVGGDTRADRAPEGNATPVEVDLLAVSG